MPSESQVTKVLDRLMERDETAVWSAVEKLTTWILDKEGPSLSREEFAEEIAGLIEHRFACILDDEEADRSNTYTSEGEEHA